MPRILHITTQPASDFSGEILESQKNDPANEVSQFDLTVTEPDYTALLDKIFDADSVQCR